MTNLTNRVYDSFSEEQLQFYQDAAIAAIARGIPKQMIYQHFLQSAYAVLEELESYTTLSQEQLNQTAVEIAHRLFMRATQHDSKSNDNSDSGA